MYEKLESINILSQYTPDVGVLAATIIYWPDVILSYCKH